MTQVENRLACLMYSLSLIAKQRIARKSWPSPVSGVSDMKKVLLTLATCALLSLSTSAQQTVRWFSSPGCCSDYFKQDHLISEYRDADIFMMVMIDAKLDPNYYLVWFGAENKKEASILIEPKATMTLIYPDKTVSLDNIDVDEVVKDVKKRGHWNAALGSFLAGMATTNSQFSGNAVGSDGTTTYNGTITSPDYAAQGRAREARRERTAVNTAKAEALASFALRKNTLFKGEEADGLLFFKKKAMSPGMILSFVIGGVTYDVPYGSERLKQGTK